MSEKIQLQATLTHLKLEEAVHGEKGLKEQKRIPVCIGWKAGK